MAGRPAAATVTNFQPPAMYREAFQGVIMFRMVRYVFGAFALLWFLWLSSCMMIGGGTVVAVKTLGNSQWAKDARERADERELREHNERANREASVHTRDDYRADYYDNY